VEVSRSQKTGSKDSIQNPEGRIQKEQDRGHKTQETGAGRAKNRIKNSGARSQKKGAERRRTNHENLQ
jgi:hypothetical protein